MPIGAIVGAAVSIGSSLLGGAGQSRDARRQRRAEQARINAQYAYDKSVEEFSWKQTQRQFEFAQKETAIARLNQEKRLDFEEATANKAYAYNLAIRNFEYSNQVRAYNESERVYGKQLTLNRAASALAFQDESRRYGELIKGMNFEHQDMLVKMLKEEGAIEARGGQGVTARRLSGDVLAQYGRNQAIQLQNVLSAEREADRNEKQIEFDRYASDVAADARRMLRPLLAPEPMAPLRIPRAVLLDPQAPQRGPRPMKGVNTVTTPSGLTIAGNVLGGAAEGIGALAGAIFK